ncbi:MAG: DUF4446 family protein [Patescibacteria group bacterium]
MIVVWNLLLTFFVVVVTFKYRRLVKGNGRGNLIDIVGRLSDKADRAEKRLASLELLTNSFAAEAKKYLQHVGLLRFNPFNEVGGEQSFATAFLDKDNNGLVISNLHGRGGSRLYAKLVKNGSGVDYDLSAEEKTVAEMAKSGVKK